MDMYYTREDAQREHERLCRIHELEDIVRQLEQDAARYGWLKEHVALFNKSGGWCVCSRALVPAYAEDLDSAIDAAMKGEA